MRLLKQACLLLASLALFKCSDDCRCGLAQQRSRIIDGVETEINEYPWQVGLTDPGNNRIWCGGALISDQWVLTAGHCVELRDFQIVLGEHDYSTTTETDSVRSDFEEFIIHPNYTRYFDYADYDFALVKLASPVDFTKHYHIRPICLPDNDAEDYNGYSAIVTGWGRTNPVSNEYLSKVLLEVEVKVISESECKEEYGSSISDQMVCASVDPLDHGTGACMGDSGGPLVTSELGNGESPGQNYEHIGVVSWGSGSCDHLPSVYARTTKQLDWIKFITSGSFNTCPRN